MPSLIDMRRRIRAVKSTQQITKAMKMVAASKLRRAQERVIATRPFAAETRRVLASLSTRIDESVHPLLVRRPGAEKSPTLVIVLTSDRGLCGSFNTNIIKAVGAFMAENRGRQVSLGVVGRKGREFFGRRNFPIRFNYANLPKVLTFADAEAIAAPAIEDFLAGKIDTAYLVYNEFKSVIAQKLVVEQLLPLAPLSAAEKDAASAQTEYLFEPSPDKILPRLLKRMVEVQVARAMLESVAAFYAAQMTAMDAATRNSGDIIQGLTLTMNKVRQAAITREIIEVVSGAQAL